MMKHPQPILNIPEPCHEDWQQMTPTEKGKFCSSCTKEVFDFSAKSDEEIIKQLQNEPQLCGRFHTSQLNRKLIADRKKRNHWVSYAASLLLPLTLFSQNNTQKKAQTEKIEHTETASAYKKLAIGSLSRKAAKKQTIANDSVSVYGVVTDNDGLPLPGASVFIKNTNIGTATDFDGNYRIKIPKETILVFSYVGFKTVEKTLSADTIEIDVSLKPSGEYTECIVVGMIGYTSKPSWHLTEAQQNFKQRVQNYFAFEKKKWKEKRAKRKAARAERKKLRLERKKARNAEKN